MTKALYARKALHTCLALMAGAAGYWGTLELVLLFAALLGVVFVAGYWIRAFDLLRRAEKKSIGELFFVAGVVCTALLTLPAAPATFVAALLVLGIADTSAAIVGRTYGGRAYLIFGEVRTYGGSFTVFVFSTLILAAFGMPLAPAFVSGWLLAAVEALAPRGSDNFVLPVVTALLLLAL